METRYKVYQRANGIYYLEDVVTHQQESLRTRDGKKALTLLVARNQAVAQPALNVTMAKAYLSGRSTGDASVTHRLVLWKSALQMAVENPTGFGTGNSGEAYMQWYQAPDSTSGYRTMVNSYLTFLVEQGWLWSTAALLGLGLFWLWALPGAQGSSNWNIALGLRASLLTFLVSGMNRYTTRKFLILNDPKSADRVGFARYLP